MLAAFLLVTGAISANELIHFKNGFTLDADSHSQHGGILEVKVGQGTLEFSADEIASFDANPQIPVAETIAIKALTEMTPEIMLTEAALAQGVDALFVRSVAQIESGLKQASRSNKGAIGLMQLMPATAKELGVDATRSEENARGGVQYLRALLLRYQGDSALALAAYNAGPGAVQKFRGVPPYLETRRYVLSVLKEYNRQLRLSQPPPQPPALSNRSSSKPTAIN